MKYNFITIEGNIGAGKTTLAHALSQKLNAKLVLEEFDENPFLAKFYENPGKYALPLELFFMAERYKQLKELSQTQSLFEAAIVSDYMFTKCLLFAKVNLPAEEFKLYQKLFDIMHQQLLQPDILIYLHAPVSRLQQNIKNRNREYEQSIPDQYLLNIQEIYTSYIRQNNQKTIFIDASNADFKNNDNHITAVLQALECDFTEKAPIIFLYLNLILLTETLTYKNNPLAAVQIPEYRNMLIGRFCFVMALRMLSTLVGWWMYELTSAPFAIGLIGLAEVIPALSLALYAGHVIDVSEKRKLLLKGISGYVLCGATLLFLSTRYFSNHNSKAIIVGGIYVIIFITGIIRAFSGPVFGAILGQMVPREILPNAITWNQGTYLSASVIGHATAGFSIAFFKNTGTLTIIVALMLMALFMLSKLSPKPAAAIAGDKRTWESVREGLNFVFSTKEVLGALSLDLFAVLFGGAVAMVPVYARDILHVGPIGFGWLNGATDMGSIIMVIALTIFPLKAKQGRKLLFVVFGFGLCIIVFGLSKIFWISFAALLVSGLLDAISVVVRGTIVQMKTPDEMRGRVMSVNSMFINSSNELGQFESGLAAKLMGVVPSVVFGGVMTMLVVIVTWIKAPTLRKMEY